MKNYASKKFDPEKLKVFVASAFLKVGVPASDAVLAAEILIDADLRGIESHGVFNLHETYIKPLMNRTVNSKPAGKLDYGSSTTASLDGDNGLGFLVGHKAMNAAIRMAEGFGTGWVTAYNSNHCGAGAYYVRMAAERNMIGIHFSTGGSTVAAPGGMRRLIGNNVLAFGAPCGTKGPFILDMAPTMAIANKLHMAQWEGRRIPEGWAVDKEGKSITDPEVYFALPGAIRPLGSTFENGIHKGFGLLLISDILTGMLSGDGGSMFRKKGDHSHAFCALRIDAFPTGGDFKSLMDEMADKLHKEPTLSGVGAVRYPGENGNRIYEERSEGGIPVLQDVVDDLLGLCAELKLSLDDVWREV